MEPINPPTLEKRKQTLAEEYASLEIDRGPFLDKARECSALTIPSLIPPEGLSPGARLPAIYQGVGARCVTNLSAKLNMALLPPNSSFLRFLPDPYQLRKVSEDPKAKSKLDTALSAMEKALSVELEARGVRVASSEALQHLVVGGNGLLYVPPKGENVKFFPLSRFVVQRDPMGHAFNQIIKESVAPATLPKDVQAVIKKDSKRITVDVYTGVKLNDAGVFDVWQEIDGVEVEGTRAIYPKDRCPYIPLRLIRIDGENYGRGFVELYQGDLLSLEGLSKALLEGSVAASKVLWLVKPGGLTSATTITEAVNGSVIDGNAEEVAALQLQKQGDFEVALSQANRIEQRLETAFLLLSGVQRQAERVTAEEIRALVQELDTSIAGVYGVLSQEFQLPLANAFMGRMVSEKRMPKLPKNLVRPTIVTGVDALGRGNDLQKLDALLEGVQEKFGPQVVATYVFPGEYMARRAAALSVDTEGLIRSEEDVQAQQQQAAQQALMHEAAVKVAPEAVRQLGAAQAAPQ